VHFLLLKIVSSVGMGLVLKHTDARGLPRLPVIRVNYAVAAVLAFFGALAFGQTNLSLATGLLGAATGVLFVAGLLCWMKTIEAAGLALSVVAMRTSIVVPVLLSAVLWRERPTTLELAGSAAALAALGLVLAGVVRRAPGEARPHRPNAPLWLAALFLVDGLVVTAAQVFRQELPQDENLPFQAIIFVSAFVVTSLLYWLRRERVSRDALKFGALLGTANLGNYLFLVMALSVLPGVVVFPTIAAGEVGLMALAGVVVWRERLRPLSWAGIVLAVMALVLIQLGRATGG
jgi:drug/metabolite transporter (DMT)-like permease